MPGGMGYAFAKASAMISRAWLKERARTLFSQASLRDMAALVAPGQSQDLPERILLSRLQSSLARARLAEHVAVIKSLERREPLVIEGLMAYEYLYVRDAIASSRHGQPAPEPWDLGGLGELRLGAWPDLGAMAAGTRFEGFASMGGELLDVELALDQDAEDRLVAASRGAGREAERLVNLEHSARRALKALRLRVYYGMDLERAARWFGDEASLPEVVQAFSLPLSERDAWGSWAWRSCLNPESEGLWKPDPAHFEKAAAALLFKELWKGFHLNPVTAFSVYCFGRLKEFEADAIKAALESAALRMGADERAALAEAVL
jgi:hypothetical protein